MGSQALEILEALGGECVRYVPKYGGARTITALVEPMRRIDDLGRQQFLTKTFDVWIVKDECEGVLEIAENADALAVKLRPSDPDETLLKITKILPERDIGVPGDGVGMWHLEAVA